MLIITLESLAGLLLLYYGGEGLVRSAAALAARFGMSPLVVGLTVVAFGTSAPELAVSLSAAITSASDIAIGNVIGSNIANVGLIVGISALIRPMAVQAKILRYYAPVLLVITSLLCFFLANKQVSRLEGLLLCAGLVAYIAFTIWDARHEPARVQRDFDAATPAPARSMWLQVGLLVAGIAMLVAGGRLLVEAAVDIATRLAISQAVIGLTVVAIGTSLPELATSLIAALRGYGDMAIGNIIGSNVFNVLGILGLTAAIEPLQTAGVDWVDIGVMTLLSVALAVFLFTRRHLDRYEGGLLLAAYLAYMAWLVVTVQ